MTALRGVAAAQGRVDSRGATSDDALGAIVVTDRSSDLRRISATGTQAVIYEPSTLPDWLVRIRQAVEARTLHIDRTIIDSATPRQIARWLDRLLVNGDVSRDLLAELRTDVLSLVEHTSAASGAGSFVCRIFTEVPTRTCGFHVDTVGPGAPTAGVLRIYNGSQTEYVEPDNVLSIRNFYRELARRERLARELATARADGDEIRRLELSEEILRIDDAPSFLHRPDEIRRVPPGAIVAFRHLDARMLWSDHSPSLAWIHRSPMEGGARLVVNVSCRGRSARRPAL